MVFTKDEDFYIKISSEQKICTEEVCPKTTHKYIYQIVSFGPLRFYVRIFMCEIHLKEVTGRTE